MTRYAPLWNQGLSYPAQLDRGLINALWPGGGVLNGAVTAVVNTMQISVAAGFAAVPMQSGQGSELCHWDAPEAGPSLVLAASPPSGQSRVDLIVVQVRDAAVDGGANNDFVIQAIAGTPAASNPAPPAVPANALPLAMVTVPGAAANLNGATISGPLGPLIGPTVKVFSPATMTQIQIGGGYSGHAEINIDFLARSNRMLLSGESYVGSPSGVNQFKAGFASSDIPNGPNNPAVTIAQQIYNGRMHWETVASGLTVGKLYTGVYLYAAAYGSVVGSFFYGGSPLGSVSGDVGPFIVKAEPI